MGIYDREYYRDEERPGLSLQSPRTATGWLILVNVAIYLVGYFFFLESGQSVDNLAKILGARVGTLTRPWLWWQWLSYGFVHSADPRHILVNMLGLWFFGREIERQYGLRRFLATYVLMLVVGGVAWSAANKVQGLMDQSGPLVGASGAVTGIIVLFALYFPRQVVYLFFVLPVPAWVLGAVLVGADLIGAMGARTGEVAYVVHLAGAAVGYLVYRYQLDPAAWFAGKLSWPRWRRPSLRIHNPDAENELSQRVDEILEKIHRLGEASLTRRERKILESASREYQRRRQRS